MTRIAIYSNELPSDANPVDSASNDFERYKKLLSAHMPETEFVRFDITAGEFPADPTEFDGVIVGGSGAMVGEDREWIEPLKNHVRILHKAGVKIWGTCFGHQLIASVFGAQIGERSPTIGAPNVEILSPEKWMHPYMPTLRIMAGNLQQVLKLGPDMRRLAMGRGNANAMYAIGDRIVGFQFHPELPLQFMEYYTDEALRKGIIDIHAHKDAIAEIHEATDHEVVAKWMAHYFLN